MSSKQSRDYYKYLFTPDSDITLSAQVNSIKNDNTQFQNAESKNQDPELDECVIENIRELLENHDVNQEVKGDTIYTEDDNSDMSISTSSSTHSEGNFCKDSLPRQANASELNSMFSQNPVVGDIGATQVSADETDTSTIFSLDTLGSQEKKDLLINKSTKIRDDKNAYFHKVLKRVKEAEKESLKLHHDLIGTFNVQNKYDHGSAAKLFLEGNFTFLSIQEPFAHQEKHMDAWKACRRNELQSARIKCFETRHQVLLFDSWKWGGKVIAEFDSKLDGRIASIAFEFGKNQKLGIISVYAMARGGSENKEEEDREDQLRQTTVFLIKKLHRTWSKKFPNIHIMILGDMQETCSISDRDNIGNTRLVNSKTNGVVAAFQDSYSSVVREMNPNETYVTRFGHKGARGIDHILFPDNSRAKQLISSAAIDKEGLGSIYFASDHKLLHCTYIRQDTNN